MQEPVNAVTGHLSDADSLRLRVSHLVSREHKSAFGQYMTPLPTARFLASLFSDGGREECRLLDAGAGLGALSCAFLDRWYTGGFGFGHVKARAFELDDALRAHLDASLAGYSGSKALEVEVSSADFVEWAVNVSQFGPGICFTHAILNPPYKKIASHSRYRQLLRQVGIETVNLYSAFVALALLLLEQGGQLVAIIPRSFCNGPYYRPFREFVLERAAIQRMHLFASRNKAFKDDDVLQENVIILLKRGASQGKVTVSTSTDDTFSDLSSFEYSFDRIVFPDDPEHFIHVPTSPKPSAIELAPSIRYSLDELGLKVSTGPVVDFRLRQHIRDMPGENTVPLLYSCHFSLGGVEWPKPDAKKPNAIECNAETEKWLYPNGNYCVVRRFSSKEERRRIVASVVDPAAFGDLALLGFENHLNVFHCDKHGLPRALAVGLAAFLNTTAVDEAFRRFNGHTQVNATDLRQMKYPSRDALMTLGKLSMRRGGAWPGRAGRIRGDARRMTNTSKVLEAARKALVALGLPPAQQNERSALCLLALLDLTPRKRWAQASNPLVGITPIMDWAYEHYDKQYAPNTRETVRRQTMHQFVTAGLALYNPDKPTRSVNSPHTKYQIEPAALVLLRTWHQGMARKPRRLFGRTRNVGGMLCDGARAEQGARAGCEGNVRRLECGRA